jgi:hypothetical protein
MPDDQLQTALTRLASLLPALQETQAKLAQAVTDRTPPVLTMWDLAVLALAVEVSVRVLHQERSREQQRA